MIEPDIQPLHDFAPDMFIDSVVRLMSERNVLYPFLKSLIDDELLKTNEPTVLFRANTKGSKIIGSFIKQAGHVYLIHHVLPFIQSVFEDSQDCEIDPSKLNESIQNDPVAIKETIERNAKNLKDHCNQFLDLLIESQAKIPK